MKGRGDVFVREVDRQIHLTRHQVLKAHTGHVYRVLAAYQDTPLVYMVLAHPSVVP